MVNDYLIKTITFPEFTVNGSVRSETFSAEPMVNGQIIKVRFNNQTSPGSFWFGESGGEIFLTKNNIASGTTSTVLYPAQYLTESTGNGAIVAGSLSTQAVVNGQIYFAASGLTSGTAKTFGPITVYYR